MAPRLKPKTPWQSGARFEFKAQDCWIGVYWDRNGSKLDIWICLIPMLPLHIRLLRSPAILRAVHMDDEEWDAFQSALGERPPL